MRRLRVLGPLEVDGTDRALGPRDRVVVSALALRPGERVDAETLAEALWGEEPPASAAKVVQGCVSRLRRCLGAECIETVAGGYRLRADQLDLDRQRFEDLVERAREHLATRSPERAIPVLAEALALWRGPAFGELEDWMPGRLEAVRLGQLRLAAEEDLLQARLEAGDHVGVASDGTVLTGQQPFRERRWALLALAQYRSGRQADALSSIRSARRALGQELGLDPGSELVVLESRILAQDASLAADHEARMADSSCPWKGLAPYGDRDGDTFFGRDADIEACLARLAESPLLVVTGPSGSGKSSLVQAGLVPALRASGSEVEVFTPGADGSLAMAAARSRHRRDPLLVVDQFEETFTLREAGFSRPWLHDIAEYATHRAPVVVVVRGDHVAALGSDEDLARLAERGLHLVAPLAGDRLREAVEGPAKVAGLRLEPGLVDLLVRDAEGQPGALPLLSHALTETWLRREAGLLTVDGYRAAGGIRDAVAASADRLHDGLSADERGELRWLMLRMVSLSDGGEPFRTPLPAAVVAALDPVRHRLLDLLVRGRLVTSTDGGYDLAHEALVRAWPRLRVWLDEDRVGQQIRRHLAMSAAGWAALDRPEGELYRGARLAGALDWLERGHEPLADTERDFLEASRVVAIDEVRRLADEARRQRRQNRRLRVLVAAACVLLVVAAAAGVVARDRGIAAQRGEEAAIDAAASARHESLVARSLALRSTSKQIAALMAVQAWTERPDVLAQSALLANLTSDPGFLGRRHFELHAYEGAIAAAAVPRDDGSILVAAGSTVALADPTTGRRRSATFGRKVADSSLHSVLRVSADGSRAVHLLTAPVDSRCARGIAGADLACTVVVVYDLAAGATITGPLSTPFPAADAAISRDGSIVAVAGGLYGQVAAWDAVTGRPLGASPAVSGLSVPRGHEIGGATAAVAFGRDDRLYVGSVSGSLRELSARTMRVRRSWPTPALTTNRQILTVGDRLVAGGDRGQLAVDLRAGQVIWVAADDGPEGSGCHQLALSISVGSSYCATRAGQIVVRNLETGERARRLLEPQFGNLGALVVADRGDMLLAFSSESAAYARWRLDRPGVGGVLLVPGQVATGGYDPTGQMLLVARRGGGGGEVVDARTGDSVLSLGVPGPAAWLSATTVGVAGPHPVLIDIPSGEVRQTRLRAADTWYPEPGGTHAWASTRRGGVYQVRRVSLSTGEVTTVISVGSSQPVRVVSDGTSVYITNRGVQESWYTMEYDVGTGAVLDSGLFGASRVTIAPDHYFLTGDATGQLREYHDLFLNVDADFPPVNGGPSSIQVSADGVRMLVTTPDQAVQLYDVATRGRIGEPIATAAPPGAIEGWLRPDGGALVINSRHGIEQWALDPEAMLAATCELAGRNWTPTEWSTYVGSAPYQPSCAQFADPSTDPE